MNASSRLAEAAWTWAGTLPWREAIARNHDDARDARRDGVARVLLFEPAAPIVTLGRRAQTDAGRAELGDTLMLCDIRGIAVTEADRGGLATLHAPGQLVVFVAIPGPVPPIRDLVCALLTAARKVAEESGVQARIDVDRDVGLWTEDGKLASVGLRIVQRCVLHGMSLNVAIDRDLAAGLVLCGSASHGYDTLLQDAADLDVSRAVARAATTVARAAGASTAARMRSHTRACETAPSRVGINPRSTFESGRNDWISLP